ncbi:MAG: epimerase [Desulfurococcaceae archaeon]|nr:MAG: epimerase [Desulfurococcaceae archaeon]
MYRLRVLITGGAGYIGSMLTRFLLNRGYSVTVVDLLLFGDSGVKGLIGEKGFKLLISDARSLDIDVVRGHDVVIDLAAISQPDPAGKMDKVLFYEINAASPARLASISMRSGVERYIFASSCGVYGFRDSIVNEDSEPKPVENYAIMKYLAEQRIKEIAGKKSVILRIASVYGYSPKMRFDLVVNAMTLSMYKHNKIMIGRPGSQARPVIHISDVVEAMHKVIEAPSDIIGGEILNVGSNDQNYRIADLAEEVCRALRRECRTEYYGDPDTRSYIVDFTKISRLIGFRAKYNVADGVREVYRALENKLVSDEPWTTSTIAWWSHLYSQGIIRPIGMSNKL